MVGCAPVGPDPAVTARRDALPGQYGLPDSRFGASIAACPDAGLLVGMPGIGWVMSTNLASGLPTFTTIERGAGVAVECGRNGNGGLSAFTAGDGGAYQLLPDGGALLMQASTMSGSTMPVVALDYDGESLVVGAPPYVKTSSGLLLTSDAGGFGAAVLHAPGFVIVGAPEEGTVTMYGLDGGVRHQLNTTVPGSRFGAALAWGAVTPGAGAQLLVGAPGERRVYVFSFVNGTPTSPLLIPSTGVASAPGFGAALAVEPLRVRDGGVLHAVWVGAPDGDEVDQFVNGELVYQQAADSLGQRFGAALAATPGAVAVGAPEYNAGSGAVFFLDSAVARPSEVRVCAHGSACTINCRVGDCVGGVLCVEPECVAGNCGCTLGFVCDERTQECIAAPDAGEPDAGASDAGEPDAGDEDAGTLDAGAADAGAPDAGPPDAGENDGGTSAPPEPARFTTSGCNAAPVTLAWFALVLLRRRGEPRHS